jgi:hypothetical protein
MAGCLTSAPVSTVTRSVHAARNGRLAAFRSELTSESRTALGTEQEMTAIRQTLGRYSHFEIGPPLLVSSKKGDRGSGDIGDVERTYKTVIAGIERKGEPAKAVYTVFVRCTLEDQTVHQDETPETCTTVIDDNGIPLQNCTPGTPASDYVAVVESCGVERFEE